MRVPKAVRGAVAIPRDSSQEIEEGTQRMMRELMRANSLTEESLISVHFTVTPDLSTVNPATSFRKMGYAHTPLMCSLEPSIGGAMERVVRVLVTALVEEPQELSPVYIQGAEKLRPDLDPDRE